MPDHRTRSSEPVRPSDSSDVPDDDDGAATTAGGGGDGSALESSTGSSPEPAGSRG